MVVDTNSFWAKVCTRFCLARLFGSPIINKACFKTARCQVHGKNVNKWSWNALSIQARTANGKSCCFQQKSIRKQKFPVKRMKDAGQTNVLAFSAQNWCFAAMEPLQRYIFLCRNHLHYLYWVSSHIESAKLLRSMKHKELLAAGLVSTKQAHQRPNMAELAQHTQRAVLKTWENATQETSMVHLGTGKVEAEETKHLACPLAAVVHWIHCTRTRLNSPLEWLGPAKWQEVNQVCQSSLGESLQGLTHKASSLMTKTHSWSAQLQEADVIGKCGKWAIVVFTSQTLWISHCGSTRFLDSVEDKHSSATHLQHVEHLWPLTRCLNKSETNLVYIYWAGLRRFKSCNSKPLKKQTFKDNLPW